MVKHVLKVFTALCLLMTLTGCEGFYELFEEEDADTGTYFVIYDSASSDEEIAAMPDVHLLKSDIRDLIKEYDLSCEVTLVLDAETENEGSVKVDVYHNEADESASDYLHIGMTCLGTYERTDDVITFHTEKDGYNIAEFTAGSDYSSDEKIQAFNYDSSGNNSVHAYANTTWDYEDAVIDEAVIEGLPETVAFTVSGSRILSYE